ncbi:MAG: mechanosensitive ion channel [Williamsia sp.]|nr:mechanosensitive ion channel [Williamsia sp.]
MRDRLKTALSYISVPVLLLFFHVVSAQQQPNWRLRMQADSAVQLLLDSSISDNDILNEFQKTFETLNEVQDASAIGFDARTVERQLPEITRNLQIIRNGVGQFNSSASIRNLQMFQLMLNQINSDLRHGKNVLEAYHRKLTSERERMRGFRRNTILRAMIRDTVMRRNYGNQLREMRSKFKAARLANTTGLTYIGKLQSQNSAGELTCTELINTVEDQLRNSAAQLFSNEYGYIWEPAPPEAVQRMRMAGQSFEGQRELFAYYFRTNWYKRVLWLCVALLFFFWITRNYASLRRSGQLQTLDAFSFRFLTNRPLAGSLVFICALAPLFDMHPPASYIELVQLIFVISLTVLLRRRWPRDLFRYWLGIVLLFLAVSFARLITAPDTWQRIILLLLSGASVGFGIAFLLRIRRHTLIAVFTRVITVIYVLVNALAFYCCISGRITLYHILGTAAVFGLTQAIGLSVFIRLVVEAFLLQVQTSRIHGGFGTYFSSEAIERRSKQILLVVAVVLWIIVFTTDLNLYSSLYNGLVDLLTTRRTIGSTAFTAGNVLLFFVIIWIANLLQKYIAYFMGSVGNDLETSDKARGSRLLLTRLLLLTIGFLLAIAASGLPLDKITIVLGALGVGIGLGLQNIVNNLVSGVILIFERPLQVGDLIETANKRGRVREIGIRSSRLLTPDGAEIVIPNGDMLSGAVTNWTLSDDYMRISLSCKITVSADQLDTIRQEIRETITQHPLTVPGRDPEILLNGVNAQVADFTLKCWCNNISKSDQFKSELTETFYRLFEKDNIQLM